MKTMNAIALDLEGTVVDVEFAHHQGHILSAQDIGIDLTVDDCFALLPHFIGGPDDKVAEDIVRLAEQREIYGKKPEDVLATKRVHYEKLLRTADIRPRQGFLDFYRAVSALGYYFTIGSLTAQEQARVLLDRSGIGALIGEDNIVLREHVQHVKPAPDVWYETAKRAGVNPSHQIVFEDSPKGICGAVSIGAYCIGMPVYNRPDAINALLQAGAKRIFMQWNEINPEALMRNIASERQEMK